MKFYFAPMEGITLYPLRNIHKEMFGESVDKYYTPFLTAAKTYHFKKREQRDALPEYNTAFINYKEEIVPQIMGNQSETVVWAAAKMHELGYNEVNLNLGCPAATVVNRGKGSGLLADTEYLERFLTGVFEGREKENLPVDISLKTRLGMNDENEAQRIMEIYAKFPIKELTIHGRVREDYYKAPIRLDAFCDAVKVYRANGGKAPICYNGDITSVDSFYNIRNKLVQNLGTEAEDMNYMIGRGLLSEPALVREICGGEKLKAEELADYLDRLYEAYAEYIPEDRNVIFKMLEHWAFIHVHFKDSEKCLKAVRKARSKGEYKAAVRSMFASCEFI